MGTNGLESGDYIHGYSDVEADRLRGSARTLADVLHAGTHYPAGALVLEAGCGVGGQTGFLLERSPGVRLVCIDISEPSLRAARTHVAASRGAPRPAEGPPRVADPGTPPPDLPQSDAAARPPGRNDHDQTAWPPADVRWLRANVLNPPFADASFDHVFVCFVLEHLSDPLAALRSLRRVLRPGGSLTVIEGDHGSCFFHPSTPEACRVWQTLTDLQARLGGDALIGRRLFSLLRDAGFVEVQVQPRPIWCDPSRPEWMDGFADRTIVGMLGGIRDRVLEAGLVAPEEWERGFRDLLAVSRHPAGTLAYIFFRAVAR